MRQITSLILLAALLASGCAPSGPLTPEQIARFPPGTFKGGTGLLVPSDYNATSAAARTPVQSTVAARSTPKDYKKSSIPTFQKVVADEMRDPESSRFRNVTVVVDANGSDALCGQINSKNAYGGYVGFEWFYAPIVALGKTSKAVIWLESKVGLDTVATKCRLNG